MLPKVETPRYTLELPSSKKIVEYRPFLVKEQKALLIALESPEDGVVEATTLAVVQASLFDAIDVKKLPKVDVDYIFIKLREKSIGEMIELVVSCGECKNSQDYILDLTKVKVETTNEHNTNIKITNDIGIIMRLPTFQEVSYLSENYTVENIYKTVVGCIEQIYDSETVHLTKDMRREEVETWVDDLNQDQYEKLENFYKTAPKIITKIEYSCNACGHNNSIELEGIEDFFG